MKCRERVDRIKFLILISFLLLMLILWFVQGWVEYPSPSAAFRPRP